MKKLSMIISILLVAVMLLGALASCGTPSNGNETESTTESSKAPNETESESIEDTTETTENQGGGNNDPIVGPVVNDNVLPVVENAYQLANDVNAYFEPGTNRANLITENQNMTLSYGLLPFEDQYVNYIQNTKGNSYIENTYDVFVKMSNGRTFYASKTNVRTSMNIYRFGYYMYEVRLMGQNFYNGIIENDSFVIANDRPKASNGVSAKVNDDHLSVRITDSTDPFIVFNLPKSYSADEYQYMQVTMSSSSKTTRSGTFYYQTSEMSSFDGSHVFSFYIDASEEYTTYDGPLSSVTNYKGEITGLRLDFSGVEGEIFNIKEIKIISGNDGNAPNLSLARSFFTYSDKMHHVMQVVAHEETSGIEAIGSIIKIPVDKVDKLIVKDDANEHHTTLDGVNWDKAEYVGFDVKDAGIFGIILPVHEFAGKLEVKIEDGNYVITQTQTPANGTLIPSEKNTLNANDFYMGERVYTDETHNFDTFLYEAYCERNPLSEKRFKINEDKSVEDAAAVGYDALRGAYKFTLKGATGFYIPQMQTPNKHYNVSFTFRGDDIDRKVYFYTATETGNLECAVLLNEDDMMLPMPLEVGKNFSEAAGERNIYNLDDDTYGEVIFPMLIKANTKETYTVVHLYQNWGRYPLKQISWIQFVAPYYHLSTGTTETNCIMPYYATGAGKATLQMLPDHRAWSAPLWENDPQHTSGGSHTMLTYTDSEGTFYSSDNTYNVVGSYGPTYADVTMYHITDDGKIKYTINHMEMPQTDENRGYYEFDIEVVEDLTISNFKQDFSFYSVTDNASANNVYRYFGYLNENNECTFAEANNSKVPKYYVLGDECPYFDYYKLSNSNDYVNLSFLIYNYKLVIGGEERTDVRFAVKEVGGRAYLTLNIDGEFTLKAGDKITINAIIMPWGSQVSEYPEDAPDYNVRDVRENTLLNPVKATPVENCEVIESVYVPKVLSTDGKTATFTISGGHNNIAIRAYGFNKLTAPKVFELIDGEWVEYVLSSSAEPDKIGNYQYYDGYCVYYDGDGKYSYSFVTTITDGSPRTFRLEAFEDFKKWPEVKEFNIEDPIDLYLEPNEMHKFIDTPQQFSQIVIDAEDFRYLSFYGNSHITTLTESFTNIYSGGTTPTGGFLVIKYRLPETNPDKFTAIEFYTSTDKDKAKGDADCYHVANGLIPDGEWHVLIIDIPSFGKSAFVPNDNGEYVPRYIRIDPFNQKVSKDTRLDVAFIGMADTKEEIFKICTDMEYVTVCQTKNANLVKIDPKTGEAIEGGEGGGTVNPPKPENTLDLFLDADDINGVILTPAQFAKIENTGDYISFYGNSHIETLSESFFTAYQNGTTPTGAFLAIKYRLPTTNPDKVRDIEFYTSTDKAAASGSVDSYYVSNALENDGEWHVIIVDIASFNKSAFAKDSDGNYIAKYIRVDPFNGKFSKDTRIDIAYIAMADTLQELIAYNSDLETVKVCKNKADNVIEYDTKTGKPVGDVVEAPASFKYFYSGNKLKDFALGVRGNNIGSVTLSDSGDYNTFYSKDGAPESIIHFYHNTSGNIEQGQYFFIKYRTSLTGERFEIYASTETPNANSKAMYLIDGKDDGYYNDGEWHLLIVDLSGISTYLVDEDGKYRPMHLRFDVFNIPHSETASLDIAYAGQGTSLSDIITFETEIGSAMLLDANGIKIYSTATGEEITK